MDINFENSYPQRPDEEKKTAHFQFPLRQPQPFSGEE
jgi:hypothetical protein